MNDLRGTVECGRAEPFNFLYFFGIFRRHTEPDPAKFEGKWFGGEDPEGMDAAVLAAYEKRSESRKELEESLGYKTDNVSWMKHRVHSATMAAPQYEKPPLFTDLRVGSYVYGYNMRPQQFHRFEQLQHCIGQLGEDHPTCQKAAWYYDHQINAPQAAVYEELLELGHWDLVKKWGAKSRRSFLPRYQPVKKNIPGMYEFYRNPKYLERYEVDASGELLFPVTLPE